MSHDPYLLNKCIACDTNQQVEGVNDVAWPTRDCFCASCILLVEAQAVDNEELRALMRAGAVNQWLFAWSKGKLGVSA